MRAKRPRYGYHANASKTWLVVKEQSHAAATALFEETGIKITTEGRPLLGAPIGTNQYKDNFISEKVDEWTSEISALANISRVHPHPAYTAYTNGQANKWVYQARVSENCGDHFEKLESEIRTKLLPTVCNRTPSDDERELVGLPTRLGGLGINNPTEIATTLHQCAVHATKPLVDHMLQRQTTHTPMTLIQRASPSRKRLLINGTPSSATVR